MKLEEKDFVVGGNKIGTIPYYSEVEPELMEMKKGDRVFFYHTGKEKAIIGTATVSKVAYPDPKDRRASLSVVELAVGKALARPVTLAEIKADKRFADMPLVRIARLSVQPVTDQQWDWIEEMAKK